LKPEQNASSKKRKAESILFTEIISTNRSDESENKEYLFTSFKQFSSNKTKQAKSSHPTTELIVSLILNHKEHLLRALADTIPFIKTYDSNTTIWSTMGGKFTTTKTGFVTFSLPEFNLKIKKQMYSSWAFHFDDRSESSSTYHMIIGQGRDLLGESGIIINFNDHTVTWYTDTIPMKDRDTYTLSSVEALIEIMFIRVQMNHKRSEMNILELPIF
jgi:hypothetical protein